MTRVRRRQAPDTAAMRFLVEDFIDVPDDDSEVLAVLAANREGTRRLLVAPPGRDSSLPGDKTAAAEERLQEKAARKLLPGPRSDEVSPQQSALTGMQLDDFRQLRRRVRDWLRSAVFDPRMHKVTLKGPLDMWLASMPGETAPLIEGKHREDVFWFYLVNLVSRAGLSRIGMCHAPKSRRDRGQDDPKLGGETEPCERLFVRRGDAKEFCSERCRARVATQRARGIAVYTKEGR